MNNEYVQAVILWLVAIATSWQVKTLLGLILLRLALGAAGALRAGTFDITKLADFARTMVVPNLLTYLGFVVAFKLIPPEAGLASVISEVVVDTAWAALVACLLGGLIPEAARQQIGFFVQGVFGVPSKT